MSSGTVVPPQALLQHQMNGSRHSREMEWRPAVDRPAPRAARLAGLAVLVVALSVLTARVLVPVTAHAFVRAIQMLMNAFVGLAMSLDLGVSLWSVVGTVSRHAAELITTRQASLGITLLMAIGALAAYALQRLLGSDEESR